jgi:hypothetical protein
LRLRALDLRGGNGRQLRPQRCPLRGTPYTSVQQAALADANGLASTPTVTSVNGTDGNGNSYVDVTVSYPFQTTVNYPGIANSVTIARTVRMAIAPP